MNFVFYASISKIFNNSKQMKTKKNDALVNFRLKPLFCLCFFIEARKKIYSDAVKIIRIICCASFIFIIILKNAHQLLNE